MKPKTQSLWRLLPPRHWPAWLALGLGRLVAQLPYPLQMQLGRALGQLAWWLLPQRRHVILTNLRLAFPEWTQEQRNVTARACMRSAGQGLVETFMCWWSPAEKLRPLMHFEGLEYLHQAQHSQRGVILLSAHFAPLELGVRIASQLYPLTAVYRPLSAPVFDYVMRRQREKILQQKLIEKHDARSLVKRLKHGHTVWYAPDQNNRGRLSALLPFFGQRAATNLATGRIAAMSRAQVLPFFVLRLADNRGYQVIFLPPLSELSGTDAQMQTEHINRLFEQMIRTAPEQYFWLHRRFKLPAGHSDPYAETAP